MLYNKTIYVALNANKKAILKMFCNKIEIKQFILFDNNINFYKKV